MYAIRSYYERRGEIAACQAGLIGGHNHGHAPLIEPSDCPAYPRKQLKSTYMVDISHLFIDGSIAVEEDCRTGLQQARQFIVRLHYRSSSMFLTAPYTASLSISFIVITSYSIHYTKLYDMVARTLGKGLKNAATSPYDVIFLNTNMPDGSGLEALPSLIETASLPEVIILTDAADADQAEHAIKMGAWDYVERPVTARSMALSLVRAIQYRTKKNLHQPHTTLIQETREEIVGDSPQIRRCLDRLALSAGSDANVLLSGETGTGKELFAWAIHNNSRNNFV